MITQEKKIKKTYVAIILDRSSSMSSIWEETLSALNENLDVHKSNASKGGETYFTFVDFNHDIHERLFNVPMDEVIGKITKDDIQPNGTTALFDAIGHTVTKLQRFDENGDVGFLVVILSDGMNNVYKKYTQWQINQLREELEGTGRWTFQYIGCDPSANQQAINTGFKVANFEKSSKGLADLSGKLSVGTSSYYDSRAMGCTSVDSLIIDPDNK